MGKDEDKQSKEPVDPELKKIHDKQIQDMKKTRLQSRASGGPPVPGLQKPMNKLDAIAQTVLKNAQDLSQLQQRFGQFAQQTEQNVMTTQTMVHNLARPDLILGPVIDMWHDGPYPHMILMVKEGMRIVAVGKINKEKSDDMFTCINSEQGLMFVKNEHVIMTYEKEEGVLYGQARRDSETAIDTTEKGSDEPKDPSVEAEKS